MKTVTEKPLSTRQEKRHQEILKLLPWLVNDTLTGKERLRVLNHLNECSECQRERDKLQRLADMVANDSEPVSDYKPAFNRLLTQVDELELERQSAGYEQIVERNGTGVNRVSQWLRL